MKIFLSFIILLCFYSMTAIAKKSQDPFVRGLQRIDKILSTYHQTSPMNDWHAQDNSTDDMPMNPKFLSTHGFSTAFEIPRYRLDGLLVSEVAMNPVIHVATYSQKKRNILRKDHETRILVRKSYIRVGKFDDLDEAMQGAQEIYEQYRDFIDSDLNLRVQENINGKNKVEVYFLDIGPLYSERHATGYCKIFKRDGIPCMVVKHLPGSERQNTFESQAIVSVSPTVFYDGEVNRNIVDIEDTKTATYHLLEGQPLGISGGIVVKITDSEIIIADASSYLLSLPIDHLPEVDRENLEKETPLYSSIDRLKETLSEIPTGEKLLEKSFISKRLVEGENVRRIGSTEETP